MVRQADVLKPISFSTFKDYDYELISKETQKKYKRNTKEIQKKYERNTRIGTVYIVIAVYELLIGTILVLLFVCSVVLGCDRNGSYMSHLTPYMGIG